MLLLVGAGLPALRQRKVTTWALVQGWLGEKVVSEVPFTTPASKRFFTALK